MRGFISLLHDGDALSDPRTLAVQASPAALQNGLLIPMAFFSFQQEATKIELLHLYCQ